MKDVWLYVCLVGGFFFLPLLVVFSLGGFFRWPWPGVEKPKDRFSLKGSRKKPRHKYFAVCPRCHSSIELAKKKQRHFECPICHCAFGHNYRKWLVAIPLAVGLTILFCLVLDVGAPMPELLAALGLAIFLTRKMPDYRVLSPGLTQLPAPTASEAVKSYWSYRAEREISIHTPKRFAAVLLYVALPVVLVILLLAWLSES